MANCLACGAPAQPDIDYCLECDVELAESFIQAREYTDERPDPQPYRCCDERHIELDF